MINISDSEIIDETYYNVIYGSVESFDLNNDGVKEILLYTYDGNLYIYNNTGSMIYNYSMIFPDSMDTTERALAVTLYYGMGVGIEPTDEVNGKKYLGFAAREAYVGILEIFPRCIISFSDGEVEGMSYNKSAGLYYYNRTFPEMGAYTWEITCESSSNVLRTHEQKQWK